MRVGFCGDCLVFGYSKVFTYSETFDGVGGRIGSSSDILTGFHCPECSGKNTIFLDLGREAFSLLEDLTNRALFNEFEGLHCDFEIAHFRSCAKEFTIISCVIACARQIKFQRAEVSAYGVEYVEAELTPEQLLERIVSSEAKAFANAVIILSRTKLWGEVRGVVEKYRSTLLAELL